MTEFRSEGGRPKAAGQSSDIHYGMPLAVAGIFAVVLRAAFTGMNADPLPWRWDRDPTPASTDRGEPGSQRKLFIDVAYNTEPDARNMRPAIYVNVLTFVPQKVVLNNVAGAHRPTGLVGYYMAAALQVSIECVSGEAGESMQLASEVVAFLMSTLQLVRDEFHLLKMDTPAIPAPTAPYQPPGSGAEGFVTTVAFEVMTEHRWVTQPIAPVIQEIAAQFRAGDGLAQGLVVFRE